MKLKLNKWIEVANVTEAQRKVDEWRGKGATSKSGTAFHRMDRAGEVVNDNGTVIARISYNGRAWNPNADLVPFRSTAHDHTR